MNNPTKQRDLTINLFHEDVFNEYGVDEHTILQEDLTSTIESLSNTIKVTTKLNLNFCVNQGINVDETKFIEAYKNTFAANIKMKRLELSRCLTTGFSLLVVGILLILLNVFVFEELEKFTYEMFSVISWVFMWAAVETLTLELIQILIEIKKSKKLLKSNLTFTKK